MVEAKAEGGERRVGSYILQRLLGKGASAKVWLGAHEKTGEKVALKMIEKKAPEKVSSLRTQVMKEVAIMRLLNHPNIMKYYDMIETEEHIVLMLEYLDGGDLYQSVASSGKLSEELSLKYFQQLISAIRHCHERHVYHRDLKPENLMLTSDGRLVLVDFGLASIMQPSSLLVTSCGSPHYVAPEILGGERYLGGPADLWSCGVILYVMVTGCLPFDDEHMSMLIRKVQLGRFYIPQFVSDKCAHLLRSLMVVVAEGRMTMEEIWEDPFFKSSRRPEYRDLASLGIIKDSEKPVSNPNPEVVSWLVDIGAGNTCLILDQLKNGCSGDSSNYTKLLYTMMCRNAGISCNIGVAEEMGSANPLDTFVNVIGELVSGLLQQNDGKNPLGEPVDIKNDVAREPNNARVNTRS